MSVHIPVSEMHVHSLSDVSTLVSDRSIRRRSPLHPTSRRRGVDTRSPVMHCPLRDDGRLTVSTVVHSPRKAAESGSPILSYKSTSHFVRAISGEERGTSAGFDGPKPPIRLSRPESRPGAVRDDCGLLRKIVDLVPPSPSTSPCSTGERTTTSSCIRGSDQGIADSRIGCRYPAAEWGHAPAPRTRLLPGPPKACRPRFVPGEPDLCYRPISLSVVE